jgi:predicted N-acetyltransferase YhbS
MSKSTLASIRPAVAADTEACGHIIYEAFRGIAEAHGFPPDFPSVKAAVQLAGAFIAHPSVFAVVAEVDQQVVGSNFLGEGDPIRGLGPITVAPSFQRGGIGRGLMEAVLERGKGAAGVRLVQDAFNPSTIALYTSVGFDVKEPLQLLRGTPRNKPAAGFTVRPLTGEDLDACAALCRRVHGFDRKNELRDAPRMFAPFVLERDGRLTGYLSAATFWIANHGVAETEEDMRALIMGAGAASSDPLSFLLPVRQASLFRWCLNEGMRVVKPMTLMAMGEYRTPAGCHFPSVFY